MQKSIFPTKIKDGMFVLTVALVVMFGSLYVDAVKGVLRGEKIHATIYLEGSSVEETLTDGNMVTAFRHTVGKVEQAGFFAVEVQRRSEASTVKLEEMAGNTDQIERLRALQSSLQHRPEIVTGIKLEVLIYKDLLGALWPLFGEKSEARIAAAGMLGEPYLQIYPGAGAGGIADGARLGFPKNDTGLGQDVPIVGQELVTYEDVAAAQQRQKAYQEQQAAFEKVLEEIAATAHDAAQGESVAPPAPVTSGPAPAVDDLDDMRDPSPPAGVLSGPAAQPATATTH